MLQYLLVLMKTWKIELRDWIYSEKLVNVITNRTIQNYISKRVTENIWRENGVKFLENVNTVSKMWVPT